MTILLKDIWPISNLNEYKVHFARYNQHSQPLNVFAKDFTEWQGWQEYKGQRNDFNRPYIFSLIQFYHETDSWLFGGVFKVKERHEDRYEVELDDEGKSFIGRLKIKSTYRQRATRTNLERHFEEFEVQEILREPYSGETFPGYNKIDHSFEQLETLIKRERPDWMSALKNIKGIYLITDTKTGFRYVGAAYGEQGVWSRWCDYIFTGHGHNAELQKLVKVQGIEYCRAYFHFTLIEHLPFNTFDKVIQERENYWKRILFSRGKQGLNRN